MLIILFVIEICVVIWIFYSTCIRTGHALYLGMVWSLCCMSSMFLLWIGFCIFFCWPKKKKKEKKNNLSIITVWKYKINDFGEKKLIKFDYLKWTNMMMIFELVLSGKVKSWMDWFNLLQF